MKYLALRITLLRKTDDQVVKFSSIFVKIFLATISKRKLFFSPCLYPCNYSRIQCKNTHDWFENERNFNWNRCWEIICYEICHEWLHSIHYDREHHDGLSHETHRKSTHTHVWYYNWPHTWTNLLLLNLSELWWAHLENISFTIQKSNKLFTGQDLMWIVWEFPGAVNNPKNRPFCGYK